MDLQRISDELEIGRLLTRYARAVDSKDWELYRSVFTEDAVIDYSSAGVVTGTREEVATWFEQNFSTVVWSLHHITNIDAEIDGDRARVRAMFYNPMQLPGVEGPSACGGYYHHELVRTPDGWRSRGMREENLWFTNPPQSRVS